MAEVIVSRIYQMAFVIFLMSFVCYMLLGLMPGDPIDIMISADPRLSAEDAQRLKEIHGLDQPIFKRYLHWLGTAVQGDFGYSRLYAQPVVSILWQALQNTLVLMSIAFVVSVSVAIPLGIVAARKIHSFTDYSINFFCFGGISIPTFWLALMLMLVFSVTLGWLPANAIPLGNVGVWDQIKALILPVVTLSIVSIGGVTRYMRAALHESMQQDYIITAYAKGLSDGQVIRRHALRNSMIPVVTILSLDLGAFFSGALVVETMFGYPGVGKLLFDSIQSSDYNLALVTLLMTTVIVLTANFIADICYSLLDPRIHYTSRSR